MALSIHRRELASTPLTANLHPVLARIYQGRHIQTPAQLDTGAKSLLHFSKLLHCDRAAALIADAIAANNMITVIGDFDADGATSTSLCMLALADMGAKRVDYLVPNRFDFGYGLSPEIVDVAAERGTQLIITVDNGIACHAGVERAKALGMTVIVTDHHLPADTLPVADAIVNPNQPDCRFPSKSLAGVGVAFYLMLALRAELDQRGWFAESGRPVPNLANYLDIVAVGTVADVVVLDQNNRILVHQGLQRIRAGRCRPGITAMLDVAQRQAARITASDLGFVVGPRLNAAGRLDDMAAGIECLLCNDAMQARAMAVELDRLNQQRKTIEQDMKQQAEETLASLDLEGEVPNAIVLFDEAFHQGVIGIVAGRLKDQHKRPTIVFARQDDDTLKGSARSVDGVHIRDLLDVVDTTYPDLIIKFGGHAAAAGLSIEAGKLEEFSAVFSRYAGEALANIGDPHVIVTDGELTDTELSLDVAQLLRQAGPFGQGFQPPLFDGVFHLVQQRIVGERHLKMVLAHPDSGEEFDAIAFNIDTQVWPDASIRRVEVAYQLDVNFFRGRESLQLLVDAIAPL
ncbi:MAG TPA: single-stranded-DNA-specific exonuclease RecJ [Alteromonas sp.]|nr:single-stranded-DNA-specific exonuclease RecJ [Alteromonadaceae bacterium]BBO29076.1 single-stranded-DNA-specific exonuclease RecJ [Alteromonas sp. I4]HBY40645.1 single-stranded-DNA-specific exonuclease RecJ [Alteromonas sp.]|tara:strand:+ start:25835 stop:27556 length:1722 start_codon:yes stop_codon:yes gene_type:complete